MNHELLHTEDLLAQVGELEHIRYHACRSARVTTEREDKIHYLVVAAKAQRARREIEAKIGDISETDWCLVKSGQRVRQLNYETMEGDLGVFEEIEDLVDLINSHALGRDMSGCKACGADKEATLAEKGEVD